MNKRTREETKTKVLVNGRCRTQGTTNLMLSKTKRTTRQLKSCSDQHLQRRTIQELLESESRSHQVCAHHRSAELSVVRPFS